MSDNPLMAIKFGEDPKGRYRAMKIAMEALAGSLCCELFDNGLAGQGIHLSCEEYAIIHPDEERPVKERPVHPAPTATKVVYSMYKEAKDDFAAYTRATQHFKTCIINAVGDKVMKAMTTRAMTIPLMTITYIVNKLEATYGIPTAREVYHLQEDKQRRCESEDDYYNYIQALTLTFELLAEQRAEESEFSKMEILKTGTAHLPNVVKAIERYVVQSPKLSDRAFEDMTNYVTNELPNFIGQEPTATANAVIHAAPNVPAPKIDDAPVTRDELQQVLAALTDQLHSIHVRLPRQGSRKPAYSLPHHMSPAPNPPRATRATGAPTRATYCFLHGFAKRHDGVNCRGMGTGSGYTDLQRRATAPAWIDGKQGAN